MQNAKKKRSKNKKNNFNTAIRKQKPQMKDADFKKGCEVVLEG